MDWSAWRRPPKSPQIKIVRRRLADDDVISCVTDIGVCVGAYAILSTTSYFSAGLPGTILYLLYNPCLVQPHVRRAVDDDDVHPEAVSAREETTAHSEMTMMMMLCGNRRLHPTPMASFVGLPVLSLWLLLWLGSFAAVAEEEGHRVRVEVYTEALCIDCFHFIQENLVPVYQLLGEEVIDLTLVPFGNAALDEESHMISCQHGAAECDANLWEQCAIHLTRHQEEHNNNSPWLYLSFIDCLETALPMGHNDIPFDVQIFLDCAAQSNSNKDGKSGTSLDGKSLQACHDNPLLSWTMQHNAAHLTPEDHTYVPWVVLNHKAFDPDEEDLLERICLEYAAGGGSNPSCPTTTTADTTSTTRP